ncbi:MAG: acylphosphatase [Candidatus Levyibacteriota bacterium]
MFAHIITSGFIQGVGFRQFVKKEAQKLELKGWVKNIDKGRVEAVFIGEKKAIDKMINKCRKGPFLSEVKDVKVEWEEKDVDFDKFEIII